MFFSWSRPLAPTFYMPFSWLPTRATWLVHYNLMSLTVYSVEYKLWILVCNSCHLCSYLAVKDQVLHPNKLTSRSKAWRQARTAANRTYGNRIEFLFLAHARKSASKISRREKYLTWFHDSTWDYVKSRHYYGVLCYEQLHQLPTWLKQWTLCYWLLCTVIIKIINTLFRRS